MIRLLTVSLMAASLMGQTATTPKAAPKAATKSPAKKTAPVEEAIPLPEEPGEYAVFDTSMGRIIALLYEKETPITVANFVALARGTKTFTDERTNVPVRRPFYNGLTFHRVIPQFMIQGGDPLGNGMGGGGVKSIPDEFVDSLKFDKPGVLAMANVGRPNTGGCQFFITTTGSLPEHLNGKHTIFGQVKVGQDVVDAISEVPRDPNDKPTTPVVIKRVLIRRVGPDPNAPVKAAPKAAPKAATKKTGA